ncbi:PQQ-binding-like beta-propeller repeat protein [Verrucomicrobiaceae bacterium 227]
MFRTLPLACLFLVPVMAKDWPEFRGPSANGLVKAKDVPVKIEMKKDLVWEAIIPGKGWSSPVMSEGLIVVTTAVGESKIGLRVVAVNAGTGKIVWDELVFEPTPEEAGVIHAKNSLASSTALIAEGVVYAHFGHMGTAALSLKEGKVAWKFHETYASMHGNGGSPVLVGGVLVISADGVDAGLVRGLDAKTGRKIWEVNREQEVRQKFSFGTPLIVPGDKGPLVVSQGSGMVGAYQPENGELVWSVDYKNGFSVVPRPVLDDGMVYVTTGFSRPNLLAITLDDAKGEVSKTAVKWSAKRDIPKTPSFVVSGDSIFLMEDSGRLSCLDKATGERLWMEPLLRNVSASLTMTGDHLYSFTEEGQGFVHRVSREGATLLAENAYGEAIFASPILMDGALIVRSEKRLRKFATK